MREADFQKNVIELAKILGWTVAHFRPARTKNGGWVTPVAADGKGFPDLFLAHPERGILAVELKSDSGRVTKEQRFWLDTIARAMAAMGVEQVTTDVWYPADMRDTIPRMLGGR